MRFHIESNYSTTCRFPVAGMAFRRMNPRFWKVGQGASTGSEQILRTPLPAGSSEDDVFQNLLLELSSAAAKELSSAEILQQFCRSSRAYFGASGAYVWHFSAPDELVGAEADGWMAERFRNARLRTAESPVTAEAIHRRKAVCGNAPNKTHYPATVEFNARSTMAVPVFVFNEVIGAAMFLHSSEPNFF